MAEENKIVPATNEKERGDNYLFNHLKLFLIILLLSGFLLRVVFLGHASYMIDEINVVRDAVNQPSAGAIISTEFARFTWYHRLPLLMLIIRFFAKLIPYTSSFAPEWITRLPFALLGTLSLPFFYLLGKELKDECSGIWTMFLATFSVFFVYYSREAYDYGMAIVFSTVVLWTSVKLLRYWIESKKFSWPFGAAYMIASAGLIYTHLGALPFMGIWNILMGLELLCVRESRLRLYGRPLLKWMITLGFSYVVFLPFLLRLMHRFTSLDHGVYGLLRGASWSVIPAVFGRMGWGESPWALIPFLAFLLLGITFVCKRGTVFERQRAWLLFLLLILYFAVQTFLLQFGRFEIRYYCFMFPLLIVFAALGIINLVSWLRLRLKRLSIAYIHLLLATVLLVWFSPSLWCVIKLKARGYYKDVAEWINKNIPENGIYAFNNIYDLRGIPYVYPTPGRFSAFPVCWDTPDDYERLQVQKRLISFFRRFPLAFYIEPFPADIVGPPPDAANLKVKPVPRESLFARTVWLNDIYFQKLVKLKTLPTGKAQWYNLFVDQILISYNKSDDLPVMARKRGEKFYHYFGPNWRYLKDGQWNDWRYINNKGTILAGNATENDQQANLILKMAAQPLECRLTVLHANGTTLIENLYVKSAVQDLTISGVTLKPGDNQLKFIIQHQKNARYSLLLLYSFSINSAEKKLPVTEKTSAVSGFK